MNMESEIDEADHDDPEGLQKFRALGVRQVKIRHEMREGRWIEGQSEGARHFSGWHFELGGVVWHTVSPWPYVARLIPRESARRQL